MWDDLDTRILIANSTIVSKISGNQMDTTWATERISITVKTRWATFQLRIMSSMLITQKTEVSKGLHLPTETRHTSHLAASTTIQFMSRLNKSQKEKMSLKASLQSLKSHTCPLLQSCRLSTVQRQWRPIYLRVKSSHISPHPTSKMQTLKKGRLCNAFRIH